MSSGQKVALSFLTALICFAGFVFFAQSGFMSDIETKYYAQSKIAQRQEQLDKLSNSCNSYISNILKKIETDSSSYLNSPAVKSYAAQNPGEKDEIDRRNLTTQLLDTIEGLEGLRLIENNGRNVHFSTFESDLLKVDGLSRTYKNYSDIQAEFGELEPESFMTDANNPRRRIIFDENENKLIISFPFFITEKTSFGSLVCYFNIYEFEQTLVNEGIISLGESFNMIIGDDGTGYGFVCGIPGDGKKDFSKAIINSWKLSAGKANAKNPAPENLITQTNGTNWVLLTSADKSNVNVGWVYKASVFELPKELIYLIYVSIFITVFLVCFLLFSLKKDYLIKVKQRIKKVQLGIINEYLENKQQIEWNQIARQLEYRKEELSLEIKKSVGGQNKKYEKIIDAYLEQSWSEIINVINSQSDTQKSSLNGASIEEIRRVMEEVLQTAKINVAPGQLNQIWNNGTTVQEVNVPEPIEEVDEIDDVAEIDEIDEIETVEDIDAVDEIEEAEAVEEIESVDEVEEAEAVEDIESVDEVEEAESVEEIESVDEVEEAEEIEIAKEPEEIAPEQESEPDPVEDIAPAEEELEDVTEEYEDLIEVGELEELDEDDNSLDNSAITKSEPEFHYVESNRTFVSASTDDFATCDTIFAEDLCIGAQYIQNKTELDPDYKFVVYIPDFTPVTDFDMELAEADELLPSEGNYYTMTGFAENDVPFTELEEVEESDEQQAIVEKKGVYSIAEDLKTSQIELNPEFKELVDSVLFR